MDTSRVAVYATVAVVLVVTLATGPIGPIEVPAADRGIEGDLPGTGNATVTVISTPETLRLVRGVSGTDVYYLRAPPTVLSVESVQGRPILTYKIDIDGLGYQQNVARFLNASREGRVRFEVNRGGPLEAGQVEAGRYDGRIRLILRGEQQRTVYETRVSVEVET
ncbi:MAG: hypothetical protein ABEH56_05320 [Salinirussus sp.]